MTFVVGDPDRVERARSMILEGVPTEDIGRVIGCNGRTVRRWRDKMIAEGINVPILRRGPKTIRKKAAEKQGSFATTPDERQPPAGSVRMTSTKLEINSGTSAAKARLALSRQNRPASRWSSRRQLTSCRYPAVGT